MNLKGLWQSKNSRIALIVGAGLLVVVAAFASAGAVDGQPGWVPAPFAAIFGATEVADGSLDGTAAGKAQAPGGATPVSNNGGTSSGDGDSADGETPATDGSGDASGGESDSDAPSTPPSTPPSEQPGGDSDAKTMTLRILYWNDTSAKAATDVRVFVNDTSWSPADSAAESVVGSLAGLPFDKKLTLVVMPDGAGGKRIEVPITLTPDMIPNSEGDAVHVEIKDATVRVLGTPVDNFDVMQDRF